MPPKRPASASGTHASSSKRGKSGSSRSTRSMAKGKQRAASGSKDEPIVVDLSDSEDDQKDQLSDDIIPIDDSGICISDRPAPRQLTPDSIITPPNGPGGKGWKADVERLKVAWKEYTMQGYAGMWVWIKRISYGDADDSIRIQVKYEDDLGDHNDLTFQAVFDNLSSYPKSYTLLLFGESTLSTAAERTFERFTEIYGLRVETLIKRILKNIQGDKSANAGERGEAPNESETEDEDMDVIDGFEQSWYEIGRGMETAKGSELDLGAAWKELKEHFAQAKVFGYRPGFTQIGDSWVFSLSMPFKNIPLDPNTIAMWDDGLLQTWKEDQRFTLLVRTTDYPLHLDKMEYWIGFDKHYKPSFETIKLTTRNEPGGLTRLYLAESLLQYLKEFPKAFKIRSAFALDWTPSDHLAFDHEQSRRVFSGELTPSGPNNDNSDPAGLGFEKNLALCAFHWILRRFITAQDHCLNCGLEVATRSLRPYVCNNALCEWTYLTMGFGPSMEHSIQHHPGVVDLLLTFAHAAANGSTRMTLPVDLNIEIPASFGITPPRYLIDLPENDRRRAIAYLIERLPKVSEMKEAIEAGGRIKDINAPPGSIGVLRWVVGSCRAYLKEAKPGEGVVNAMTTVGPGHQHQAYYGGGPVNAAARQDIRQFTFVVGSPEQERDFKTEIDLAKRGGVNKAYPTFLAFHGSATERWHNILRTGLDFQETANGRTGLGFADASYGHGVYFAHDASTSLGTYSRASSIVRPNADFPVIKAVACVELVNVPNTFVSSNPFYVVNNVKQIKPFLLLVQGTGDPIEHTMTDKELFRHDPQLRQQPAFYGSPLQVAMPDKYTKYEFFDEEPDDADDARFLPSPVRFTPSPQSRFQRLELMPPPSATSTMATRALQKEFKAVVKAQKDGELPFYIDPDTDSLYCWTVELWEFPKSALKSDMTKFDVKSIIAEIRFPASFPHSPPFMRALHPRCLQFNQGGGGNITAGGSICHEILTATGWNPAFTMEAVIRGIMTNMTEATPPAKLDPGMWDRPYRLDEAIAAFKRVATAHGWEVPKDFDKMAR